MSLIFVDCEGHGPCAGLNSSEQFEFGAVEYETRDTFHGQGGTYETFLAFEKWLEKHPAPYVFVSDNPAYDWQFINYYFHFYLHRNPFGHSARRIGDFYAGLLQNFRSTQEWKKWRRTKHSHQPVEDSLGNVEAFETMMDRIKCGVFDSKRACAWTSNIDHEGANYYTSACLPDSPSFMVTPFCPQCGGKVVIK